MGNHRCGDERSWVHVVLIPILARLLRHVVTVVFSLSFLVTVITTALWMHSDQEIVLPSLPEVWQHLGNISIEEQVKNAKACVFDYLTD